MEWIQMLTSVLEINKAFDETLKKSIPYLIFPHRDYRERLVDLLTGFCQYHRENNELAFIERYNTIHNFLNDCETDGFDTFTALNIHYLATHQKSLHQIHFDTENRLRALEADVSALKRRRPFSSMKKEEEEVVDTSSELPVVDEIPEPIDPNMMTSEQKTTVLINTLKSNYKPLSTLSISKISSLTVKEVENRIHRMIKNSSVIKLQLMRQRRNATGVEKSVKTNHYIWKDNIPADGIIPEPDE